MEYEVLNPQVETKLDDKGLIIRIRGHSNRMLIQFTPLESQALMLRLMAWEEERKEPK